MRKKNAIAFYFGMLIMLGILFATVSPLHLLDPISAGLLALAQQEAPNPAPQVIPSLREWQGGNGSFALSASSHIAVDAAYSGALAATAHVFQNDLATMTKQRLPIITTSSPSPGDFFLTLRNPAPNNNDGSYLFQVGDAVVISARTTTGVFYGTRTALQILAQDPQKARIPRGNAMDYPQYAERGFMLDAGRKFFPLPELENYVKMLAFYKMNDFHIHLNDNAIGGGDSPDWMHQYAAFRLNSPRFPGLAAADGSYTKQDIQALEQVAAAYHVTIIPEIDMPAHDLALTQYRPDLASPTGSKEFLDLSNPNTYTFLYSLWNEFLPWFPGNQVDIGADEYTSSAADAFRTFINTFDAFLHGKGKSVRMWGSLSKMPGNIVVNTNITIEDWNNGWANPVDMANQGYNIINANDNLLYIVPKAGYYNDYLDTQTLFYRWEPNIFSLTDSTLNLPSGDSHIKGGMFSEWNDMLGSIVSDADVASRVEAATPTLSQKLWSASTANMSYSQFAQLAGTIGAPAIL